MKRNLQFSCSRIHRLQYLKTSLLVCLFYLVFCFSISNGIAAEATTTAEADRFLKQLIGAEHHGMGGSFVGATDGANALGNNPAGIGIAKGNRFVIHMARFPRTVALLSKPNFNANYEDYSQYEQRAAGIETLNWAFPIGRFGTIGVALSTAHEGSFRRVNHEGKALNSFPENNLAIGIGYGLNFGGNTVVGFDAKWLRSKVTDTLGTEHFGRGYAYNVGLIQKFGNALQAGIVVRNLSNGLSFVDPTIPDKIRRDVIAGITYQREISNMSLRLGFDLHPPFRDGIRANLGAEVWFRNRIGGRIGYLRDTEKRYASAFLLEDATFEMEERNWKAEGLCFGFGARFGNITLNAAYTPQFKPSVSADERIHIVQGTAVYTFSIGQDF
ncbi:hypothetical protein C6501_15830 [Candidatus Poribacteria bacterium]|nr:MAG: hypothetical protein C6501_15830 [Candidatus Poribacteria bacterium]